MTDRHFARLRQHIRQIDHVRDVGRVHAVRGGVVDITGLGGCAQIGDRVVIRRRFARPLWAEVIRLDGSVVSVLAEGKTEGLSLGDTVIRRGPLCLYPDMSWLGRVVSASGIPLDDEPLSQGAVAIPIEGPAPAASTRRPLGDRLQTGMAAFNTFLPLVKGQRLGLFSGSGVGKSTLLGAFARSVSADVTVVALIGERGRELGSFLNETLGPEGLARSVVIAATSDQSAPERRRCALSAMAVAEYFRDQGLSVLFLADSLTRFAEAHRELVVAQGEPASLRGHPASMAHAVMSLCERAGPGGGNQGATVDFGL
jgi:flagellum-specific ATP synthase